MGFKDIEREPEQYVVTIRDKSKPVVSKPMFIPAIVRATMLAPFESFEHLGTVHSTSEDSKYPGRHIYIDRGSKVLGVAHLDSVQKPTHFWANKNYIACPTIDNRLGAWILLHGLPSMGIYPDVLLTENEERGISTAFDFQPDEKRWNWMFSFDRMNTDVVLYQYGGGELESALKLAGFKIGTGSYSCIAELDHLGVEGVNVGCTMSDYHGSGAYALVPELTDQLVRFAAFYRTHEKTKYEYSPKNLWKKRGKRTTYTTTTGYNCRDYEDDGYGWEYYRQQSMSYPNTHAMRINDAIMRLRREGETIERILKQGILRHLDNCATLEEWYDMNVIPEGSDMLTKIVPVKCKRCNNLFAGADTTYSYYFTSAMCKACHLLLCEAMLLLPADWRDELDTVTKELEGEQ